MWWLGAVLVLLTAGGGWLADGAAGLWSGLVAGSLALTIHVIASAWMRRKFKAELKQLAAAMAGGMGLRMVGVGILVAGVTLTDWFSPGPTLIGYVAVLIPLLFMEMRFLK